MSERETLAIPALEASDGLGDFEPRGGVGRAGMGARMPEPAHPPATELRRAVDAFARFPSREASHDAQLNLKGPRHVLDRFRTMCKADRRAYYDMLEILMDRFEGRDRT